MKYIPKLIINFIFSFISIFKNILISKKFNLIDFSFLLSSFLLLIGLLFPWILIIAFITLLPALYKQLYEQKINELKLTTTTTTNNSNNNSNQNEDKNNNSNNSSSMISSSSNSNLNSTNEINLNSTSPNQTNSNLNSTPTSTNPIPITVPRVRKCKKRIVKEEWGIPTLRVVDPNGKIIPVNPGVPTPMESDCFKGFILIMVKCDGEFSDYDHYKHHFKGKQRKFEVQFQGKMKFVPKGEVMLGGELSDRMQVSFVTRSLLSFLMKFAMSLNPFLHFGFGEEPKPEGNFEYPHLTFPLFRVMDRVVVTSPNEQPPELGKELPEVDSDRLLRRSGKGPHMSFKEGYTYSFSFHSMYIDFTRWSICNFPGYRAIDLRGFFGQQKVKLVCYELVDPKNDTSSTSTSSSSSTTSLPHYNCYKHYLLSLEMSHTCMMTGEELVASEQEIIEESDSNVSENVATISGVIHNTTNNTSNNETNNETNIDNNDNNSIIEQNNIENNNNNNDNNNDNNNTNTTNNNNQDINNVPNTITNVNINVNIEQEETEGETENEKEHDDEESSIGTDDDEVENDIGADTENENEVLPVNDNNQHESEDELGEVSRSNSCGSLGTGAEYVTSNSVVSIISIPPPWDNGIKKNNNNNNNNGGDESTSEEENQYNDCYISIADVSGTAVRKECTDTTIVRFIRPQSNHLSLSQQVRKPLTSLRKSFAASSTTKNGTDNNINNNNSVLCSGDEVMIQCASTGRFLTIHRGWWISWTAEDTGSKCLFTIHMMGPSGLAYASRGTKLIAGKQFRLRSVRWSEWEVGYCVSGNDRAGQQVVLYQSKLPRSRSAPMKPLKWGKNNKFVNPLCLCVLPEMSSPNFLLDSSVLEHNNHQEGSAPILSLQQQNHQQQQQQNQNQQQSTSLSTLLSTLHENNELKSDELKNLKLYFYEVFEDDIRNPQEMSVKILGWVEMLHRGLNKPQLAYIVQVKCKIQGELKKWTTLRTQKDFDELLSLTIQSTHTNDANNNNNNNNTNNTNNIPIQPSSSSPQPSQSQSSPKKMAQTKKKPNFSEISSLHQCSPEQSVHIMLLKIKSVLEEEQKEEEKKENELVQNLEKKNHEDDGNEIKENNKESKEESKEESTEIDSNIISTSTNNNNNNNNKEINIENDTNTEISDDIDRPTGDGRDALFERTEDTPRCSINQGIFLKTLSLRSELDQWFLETSKVNGIEKYLSPIVLKRAVHTAIIARALWDTHWREEIVVLYPTHLAFYSPMAKKASWTLSLQELIGISHISDDKSPLLGKSILKIETIGRVHYIAFSTKESCNNVSAAILEQFSGITFETALPSYVQTTDPRDRFVLKSGRWKPNGRRLVLNARKFTFDLPTDSQVLSEDKNETYWEFSARLLKTVFQLDSNNSICLSSDTLKNQQTTSHITETESIDVSFETNADGLFPGREKIISFLDETVRLKLINFQEDIDFSSPEALCFFVNIYHTLLIHARLVLNPPSTQDWATFFDNVCYEIGGDIFSLSELEYCVIGGKLQSPINLSPHFSSPPPLNDGHYAYSLQFIDRRVHFIINCCSISNPNVIYLLKPDNLFIHLNDSSFLLFEKCLQIDMKRRIVTLPKICDTYRTDFGINSAEILKYILRYLQRDNWEKITLLLSGSKFPTIKYYEMECRSHDSLQLMT